MDANKCIIGQWTLIDSRLVWVWAAEEKSTALQPELIRSRPQSDNPIAAQKTA